MLSPIRFSGIEIKRQGTKTNTEARLRQAMDQYNPMWQRWFHIDTNVKGEGKGRSIEVRQNTGYESLELLQTVAGTLQQLGVKTGAVTAIRLDDPKRK